MIYEKEIKGEIINIEVGMGATKSVGSDCYPYTVIKVQSNGYFVKKGRPLKYYWDSIHLGIRKYYRDPSF